LQSDSGLTGELELIGAAWTLSFPKFMVAAPEYPFRNASGDNITLIITYCQKQKAAGRGRGQQHDSECIGQPALPLLHRAGRHTEQAATAAEQDEHSGEYKRGKGLGQVTRCGTYALGTAPQLEVHDIKPRRIQRRIGSAQRH